MRFLLLVIIVPAAAVGCGSVVVPTGSSASFSTTTTGTGGAPSTSSSGGAGGTGLAAGVRATHRLDGLRRPCLRSPADVQQRRRLRGGGGNVHLHRGAMLRRPGVHSGLHLGRGVRNGRDVLSHPPLRADGLHLGQ
jgi:uncharacterized protein YceK